MCQCEIESSLQDFKSDLMMKWSHDQLLNYTTFYCIVCNIVLFMYNFEISIAAWLLISINSGFINYLMLLMTVAITHGTIYRAWLDRVCIKLLLRLLINCIRYQSHHSQNYFSSMWKYLIKLYYKSFRWLWSIGIIIRNASLRSSQNPNLIC